MECHSECIHQNFFIGKSSYIRLRQITPSWTLSEVIILPFNDLRPVLNGTSRPKVYQFLKGSLVLHWYPNFEHPFRLLKLIFNLESKLYSTCEKLLLKVCHKIYACLFSIKVHVVLYFNRYLQVSWKFLTVFQI